MNILIDGNAFLNVAASIVKNILLKDRRVGEKYWVSDLLDENLVTLKQVSKDTFRSFSVNYLGSIFAPFKDNISSVFFVFDSKSWRKQFIKDHFQEHGEGDFSYKGNRKHEDNLHLFFEYFQTEILQAISDEYGIVVNRVQGAEGDDLIAYICENLNEDICIWSVDKDLTQLLESGERRIIMMMPKQMTKFKKIYTTADFDKIEKKPVDIFNFGMDQINNATLVNIIRDLTLKDYQHITIDPAVDVLTKIIGGDQSDKIPRIHPKMTASKVSKSLELILEKYSNSQILNLIDSGDEVFSTSINDITCEVLKMKDPDERQTLQNNISRNKTLIRLNTAMFPTDILESIKNSINISSRRKFNYYKFKKNYKQ